MCDVKYYEPDKTGCTYPSVTCPECRKYYDRACSLKARVKSNVDYKFIRHLLDRDRCEYCGKKLAWNEREIEHKMPVNKGGDNSNSNLCISCFECNREKQDRTYDEYIEFRKNQKVTASDIKTLFDLFSKHTLLETEQSVEEVIEHHESEVKHKIIKDDEGRTVGLRKVFVKGPAAFKIKKQITRTHLTEWGEAYNTLCEITGRKPLKEGVEVEILSEKPVSV